MSTTTQWVRKLSGSVALLQVLVITLIALAFTQLVPLPPVIDPLIVFVAVAVGLFCAMRFFIGSLGQDRMPYFSLQLIFLWIGADALTIGRVGVSIKPHILAVGYSAALVALFLIRDFKYFWRFTLFRTTFIFFLLNVFYYLFYHTDFVVSSYAAGFPLGNGLVSEFAEADARSIVFMGSVSAFIATTAGIAFFRHCETKQQLWDCLINLMQVLISGMVIYFFLVATNLFVSPVPGAGVISGLLFFIVLTFYLWTVNIAPNLMLWRFKLSTVIVCMMPLLLASLFIATNKTSLIGLGLTFIVFLLLHQLFGFKLNWSDTLGRWLKSPESKIMCIAVIIIAVLLVLASGILNVVSTKLEYFSKGYSSLSTLSTRTGNWKYFIDDWRDTLTPGRFLYGFGTGASRQTIFFVSAMRQAGTQTLVQTLHDTYMEFFYDYGLLAFIQFSGLIAVIAGAVKELTRVPKNPTIRAFSILSLSVILYLGIYALMDGVRVQILIVFFSILGLTEGLKRVASQIDQSEMNPSIG